MIEEAQTLELPWIYKDLWWFMMVYILQWFIMMYDEHWWTMMDYVEFYTRIYHGVANAPLILPDSTGSREMPSWLQRSSLIPQPLSRQLGIAWHSGIAKFCPVEEWESLWDPDPSDPSDPVCACLRCLFAPVRSPIECSLLLKLRMHGTSHRNWQSSRPLLDKYSAVDPW